MGSEEEKVMYLTYTPEAGELPEDTLANLEVVEEELLKRDDIDILQLSITDSGRCYVSDDGRRGRWCINVPNL